MAAAKNIRPSSLSFPCAIISALYTHSLASLIASLTHPSWSQPVTEFTHNFFTRTKSLASGREWGWTSDEVEKIYGKVALRPKRVQGGRVSTPLDQEKVWQLRSREIEWVSWGERIGCGGGGQRKVLQCRGLWWWHRGLHSFLHSTANWFTQMGPNCWRHCWCNQIPHSILHLAHCFLHLRYGC